MSENSIQSALGKIKSMKNSADYTELEKTKNAAELPVAGQDKVVEMFNKCLEAAKTAISYPWLKEPYEGIYKELSEYNKDITKFKNNTDLIYQIGNTLIRILGYSPSSTYNVEQKLNKVPLSIYKECCSQIEPVKKEIEKYPWFKLSYNAICLNCLYKKDVPTGYIPWFEEILSETKKLLKTIGDIPKWCDIEKYGEALEALKTKKESDDNWKNNIEITDDIRKKYFINYGYANGWDQNTSDKFTIAAHLHNRDLKEHPELHDGPYHRNNARCDSTTYCSCGFSHSVDSSD
jgi:hypothetical protein